VYLEPQTLKLETHLNHDNGANRNPLLAFRGFDSPATFDHLGWEGLAPGDPSSLSALTGLLLRLSVFAFRLWQDFTTSGALCQTRLERECGESR